MKLCNEDYVARIASADRARLLIINYELLAGYLKGSIESFGAKDFDELLNKAHAALELLMNSLDLSYDVAKDLMRLYIYVNKLIISARFAADTVGLKEALSIIETLLSGWEIAAKTEQKAPPVMESGQRIVAGLTYKNGELNEVVIDEGNRGYQA